MSRYNSKPDADAGKPWKPEKKPDPKKPEEVIEILHLYGYYLQKWGEKVHAAFMHLGAHVTHPPGLTPHSLGKGEGEKMSTKEIVSHLDPPPPPWEE